MFCEQFEARMYLLRLFGVLTKSIRSGANWYNAWIKSLLFVRSYKGDGPAAWKALCDRFKSFERPRLQQLIEKLTPHLEKIKMKPLLITLPELKTYNTT